jgi:hypothetical protein
MAFGNLRCLLLASSALADIIRDWLCSFKPCAVINISIETPNPPTIHNSCTRTSIKLSRAVGSYALSLSDMQIVICRPLSPAMTNSPNVSIAAKNGEITRWRLAPRQ